MRIYTDNTIDILLNKKLYMSQYFLMVLLQVLSFLLLSDFGLRSFSWYCRLLSFMSTRCVPGFYDHLLYLHQINTYIWKRQQSNVCARTEALLLGAILSKNAPVTALIWLLPNCFVTPSAVFKVHLRHHTEQMRGHYPTGALILH